MERPTERVDFRLLTPAFVENSEIFLKKSKQTGLLAIEEADVILFMTDVTCCIHELDETVSTCSESK